MDWFSNYDDRDFVTRFRLSKASALFQLERVEADLEYTPDRNASVSPMGLLPTTLRFYATECSQLTMGDYMGASKSTIHRIIQKVSMCFHCLPTRGVHYIPSESGRNNQGTTQFL
ncbi:hypothetical protein R5R35_013362 [Gryllus longicercus]|uniref:Nuclease HARBI1 n=1 Tax=Gryllus longicercus TaxID=2509291 RepID=A0AAN9VTB2_9ORTH